MALVVLIDAIVSNVGFARAKLAHNYDRGGVDVLFYDRCEQGRFFVQLGIVLLSKWYETILQTVERFEVAIVRVV